MKELKEGDWITYKDENWNVYKVSNEIITLHPETDDGFSNGLIINISLNEIGLTTPVRGKN